MQLDPEVMQPNERVTIIAYARESHRNELILNNNSIAAIVNQFENETEILLDSNKIFVIAIPNYLPEKMERRGNIIFTR